MEWRKKQVLELITLYRDRPVLWDRRAPGFKNRSLRSAALLEVAQSFDVDKDEISRKFKNLLCHFSRECKMEKDKRGGRVYESQWFAYEALLFLKDRPKYRKDPEDVCGSESEESSMEPISSEFVSGISIVEIPKPPRKRVKSLHDESAEDSEMIEDDVVVIPEDTCSLWSKLWESKLRELPAEQALHAEKLITEVLYEASLGNLSRECSLNVPTPSGNS